MLINLSINEVKLLKEALMYNNRGDLLLLLQNNEGNRFDLTDDQIIDMEDSCQDYFLYTGLDESYEATAKGQSIERLIDKLYNYLEDSAPS